MPRNITVTFADGSQHEYRNTPDSVTPSQVEARAQKEYGQQVVSIDGGRRAQAPAAPEATQANRSPVVDTANAVGTGYFRGLTRLAGLPVDTVANVIDLGKAALGSGYIAATGNAPPSWLEVGDRSKVMGSGDNLVNALSKTQAGNLLINPANPDYEGGAAQAIGGGLTAVMAPSTSAQAANQAALGASSAVAGKLTYELTGDPTAAITASLLPAGAQQAAGAAGRRAIRGGETGRREMEQRIQDLRNAGIEQPTLGLASGNRTIGEVENILQSTPGAVGTMTGARDAAISGLRRTLEDAAGKASNNRGSMEAGSAIQRGIGAFKDTTKDQQARLYSELGEYIEPQYPTNIGTTKARLAEMNAPIKGAPELSKQFQNSRIMAIEDAIAKDTAGAPQSVQVYTRRGASGGLMNAPVDQTIEVVIPEGPPRNTLPFDAVKKTRTLVGNEIADNMLTSTVPQSKWRNLYGALSEDIGNTAREVGPGAERAYSRANDYTRASMNRLERIAPLAQTPAPEQAFTAIERAARENVSTLQAVKKALPQDARGSIAGTIIERLGRASNANQNEAGTAWSPETFLTNWNRMTPKAREELFSGFPNAPQVKASVDAVAKATAMMRDNSKMWANPSGTAANLTARIALAGTLGSGGAYAAGLLNPAIPAGMAGGMVGARALAAALRGEGARDFAVSEATLKPYEIQALVRALSAAPATGSSGEK